MRLRFRAVPTVMTRPGETTFRMHKRVHGSIVRSNIVRANALNGIHGTFNSLNMSQGSLLSVSSSMEAA